MADDDIIERLYALLQGESVIARIDQNVVYKSLSEDPANIYSLLLVAGYLKTGKKELLDDATYLCEVSIPNKEIAAVYRSEVLFHLLQIGAITRTTANKIAEESENSNRQMRRKDREITDKAEMIEILKRCDTVRLGINGEQYPYVVPVSFGMEIKDTMPVVYFHCAKQGMKLDLLQKNANVCLEGDTFFQIQKTAHGITTRYESIIGFGKCSILENTEEKIHGLSLILEHYHQDGYPLERCKGLENLYIGKIVLDSITGKQNLPEEEIS